MHPSQPIGKTRAERLLRATRVNDARKVWERSQVPHALRDLGDSALGHALSTHAQLVRGKGSTDLQQLLSVVAEAMSEVMARHPSPAQLRQFLRVLDRTLVPVLWGIAEKEEAANMGWAPLLSASIGFETPVRQPGHVVLLSSLLPYRADPTTLPRHTQRLVKHAPTTAPLVVGILGHHLRMEFAPEDDAVDLAMMGAALPAALRLLQESRGAGKAPLARVLVSGLTFSLKDHPRMGPPRDHYLAHFVRWMELARDHGVSAPEALLRSCFQLNPRTLPREMPRWVAHTSLGSHAKLGGGFLGTLGKHPLAPDLIRGEGVWGLLSAHPRWQDYLAATPADRKAEPTYRFLQQVEEPRPANAVELQSARSALEALQSRLPECIHSPLFARTEEALTHKGGGNALALEWLLLFEELGANFYAELRTGKWRHPYRDLAACIANRVETETR